MPANAGTADRGDTEWGMAQQKAGAHHVRIIGGKWKGRKLRFIGGSELRPTLGRVRETLFNWLRPEIDQLRCLDAFAGSGILGFEALSQGAADITLVEHNPRTVQTLKANINALDIADRARVVRSDIRQFLRKIDTPFDLIFLDPPFAQPNLLHDSLRLLMARKLATRWIYAEASAATPLGRELERHGLRVEKQTRAGETVSMLATPAAHFD